ncbi:hypothetical protein [Kibdelosporangium aridum]|uniref:hypothetical protein n=1 Tax=Kibdelosporangium aridum TaxID=2030 RepID=UPI00117AD285|nr:hypothetical protein [Kibdelosporangium aridum]
MYIVVFVLGAFGGLIFELNRDGLGQLERPRSLQRRHDTGWVANVLIGAAAAMAALYLFPPKETVVTNGGVTTSTLQYHVVAVIGLSIIIGSAGGAFLAAFQARALALLKAQEAEATKNVATGAVNELAKGITDNLPKNQLQSMAKAANQAIRNVGSNGNGNPAPGDM